MPEVDQAKLEKAHQARISGDYDTAKPLYDELLAADDQNAEIWWARGLTIMNMGEFDEAVECLRKSVELEPDNQRYLLDLGKHLAMLGMEEEAVRQFERVVEIDPSSREGGDATTQLSYY